VPNSKLERCGVPGCSVVANLTLCELPLCSSHFVLVTRQARQDGIILSAATIHDVVRRLAGSSEGDG
jgi:hypothetical protein